MYKNIIDPDTKKKINIYSKKGFKILKRYILYGGKKFGVEIKFGNKRLTATSDAIKTSDPTQTEVGIQHFKNAENESITLFYKRLTEHEYNEIISNNLIEKWSRNLIESYPVNFSADEYRQFDIDEKIIYIKNVNNTLANIGKITDLIYIHLNINGLYASLLQLLNEQKLIYLDIKLENIGCIEANNRWIFIDNESTIASEHGIFPVPIYFRHFYGIIPYEIEYGKGFQIQDFYEGGNIINDFKIKSLYILLLLVIVVEIYTGIRKECKWSTRTHLYVKHYKDIFNDNPELGFWEDIYNIFLDTTTNSDDKWKSIVEHFEIYLNYSGYRITTNSDSKPNRRSRSLSPNQEAKGRSRSLSPKQEVKGRSRSLSPDDGTRSTKS